MALKDWKKSINKKGLIVYQDKNSYRVVEIGKLYKTWVVQFGWMSNRSGYQKESYKNFKTKKQALTYAKSYMRKH